MQGEHQPAQQSISTTLSLQLRGADDAAFRIREGKCKRFADLGPGQDLDPGVSRLLHGPRGRRVGFGLARLGQDHLDAQTLHSVERQNGRVQPVFGQHQRHVGDRGGSARTPLSGREEIARSLVVEGDRAVLESRASPCDLVT